MEFSVRLATVAMTETDLKGNAPYAVSPLSMTASAPSRTAMAISETSALVGVGLVTMLSSIFVATITGFPRFLQPATILFCHSGTCNRAQLKLAICA